MGWINTHMHRADRRTDLPEMRLWSLRFVDQGWDDRYRLAQRHRNLISLRFAFMIAIGLNTLFAPQDYFFFLQNGVEIALWRGIGMNLMFIVLWRASYLPYFASRWPGLLMMAAFSYTVFQSLANVYGGHPEPLDASYILMIFIIYALMPFFYFQAVNCALMCTGLYIGLTLGMSWPPPDISRMIFTIMILLSANLVGFVALRQMEGLRRQTFASNELIDAERARVRELLDRILPASVATRLREGETGIVEELADVTVMFADVEGFTSMAAECAPEETLRTLSNCFERFDRLVQVHHVEKIKTVGDAYMVAAGAPKGADSDARHMAALALDMLKAVADVKRPDGSPLQIRIGMARGPLIAGVVGDSRFLYDLWGDAVNTASRMETTGTAGRIQVTEDVVEALSETYVFESRGEVDVKGKGMMPTWWLTSAVAPLQAAE